MYPIGDQFKPEYDRLVPDTKCIITGKVFRISILSNKIIRLEYNTNGVFVDRPTMFAKRRNLGNVDFSIKQDNNYLEVTSKYFILSYIKEQPFVGTATDPARNLRITLNSHVKDRRKDWFYLNPEVRNMNGNLIGIDVSIPKQLERGLFSLDGFASIDDSNNMLILEDGTLSKPPEGHYDIYVFMYDIDINQCLFDYFKLTGSPVLPPRYAFGNWWSRNISYNEKDAVATIRNFEKNEIPISVFLFDNDWHYRNVGGHESLKCGYTFNQTLFKDPKALIDKFHDKGIRVGLTINPMGGIFPHERFYKQAAEYLGVSDNQIILFDPTNPKLMDVLFKVFLHPLESVGVDLFWNDSIDSNPINMWALNNYLFLDSNRSVEKRGLILSRGSVYAPHLFPVVYGGSSEVSWDDLRMMPFRYCNASNAGISFISFDVGGNHGGIEDGELYIRYIELSCFSPILRFHGARGQYYKREPWLWDIETLSMAKKYLQLRYRLIPYIYSEAYNYTKTGVQLVQPFYYNYMWTYDDTLYRCQYYFGSQLLVCPILDKMDPIMNRTIHRFFMPDGIWYDFITGKKFPGNKKYISFFKEEDYPVFAHAGSIIPLSIKDNNKGLPTDLEIQIFPGLSNTYVLYEDDGVSRSYKDGYFLKTSIDYNYLRNNYTLIIRSLEGKSGIIPAVRNYKIVFRNTKQADNVGVYFNSEHIDYESYIDDTDFVVEVNDVSTIGQLTINCKGKDIEIDAVRLINDDVNSILMDIVMPTYTKELISQIMFSNEEINQKRVKIRKMKKQIGKENMNLFLRLLDYINEV